jgi:hypothetical protein
MATTVLGVALLLVATPGSLSAAERSTAKEQRVDGIIYAPTGEACGFLVFEQAVLESAARSGNLIGYSFSVNPATRGQRFALRAIDAPVSDLDISFDVAKSFETRAPGGERGIVPEDAQRAHVCLHSGAATAFVYTASVARSKR